MVVPVELQKLMRHSEISTTGRGLENGRGFGLPESRGSCVL
jgi:hypothetical protein